MSAKLDRLFNIYNLLKSRPVTISYISTWAERRNLKISERTFYRDLRELEKVMLGANEKIVVSIGEKNKKTWKIEFSESEELNEFDIDTYYIIQNFLPSSLYNSRKDSQDRIQRIFYKNVSKSRFEDFASYSNKQLMNSKFSEHFNDNEKKLLSDLLWTLRNSREIEILEAYYDFTSLSVSISFPLVLLPLQLIYHRGVMHIVGFLKDKKTIIILALDQISKYQLTNISFDNKKLLQNLQKEMGKRFGITQNINTKIYSIELEFSGLTGSFVKNAHWHHTQQFEQLPSGNYRMTMECGLNRELVGWIFMWMSNVKVLKPAKLRDLVLNEHAYILKHYQGETLVSHNSFLPEE